MGTVTVLLLFVMAASAAEHPKLLFSDDFESHAIGQLPHAPWKEETYKSGAVVTVDDTRAFSGRQSLHILTPAGAKYRRGYVAIHLRGPLPEAVPAMYGRAMFWLEAAPQALPGQRPVHWTLLQGEGRSADDRYNAIYRLGLEERDGLQLMANYETTPPVSTDCKRQSKLTLPLRRWVCVEWHFVAADHELDFWLDGARVAHVRKRIAGNACRGNDLGGEWRAPPGFDSLYIGFERYADAANDQNLWVDDVQLSNQRVGCRKPRDLKHRGGDQ
jgi:hypothetical protein